MPLIRQIQKTKKEAAEELLRLAYWPKKGWLLPQVELPDEEVIQAAHRLVPKVPKQPSPIKLAVVRNLSHNTRRRLMAPRQEAA